MRAEAAARKRGGVKADSPSPCGRGNRSCVGDGVWILPDGRAPRRTSRSKASKPDTEFHGVRPGAPRSRYCRASRRSHGTVLVVLREAPKASTPWNSGPYSVKLRVGLA